MRTLLMGLLVLWVVQVVGQQQVVDAKVEKITDSAPTQVIKLGAAFHNYPGHHYDYYDSYYGYYNNSYSDNRRGYFSLSYEYTVPFANDRLAYAVEPKIGFLLKENAQGGFAGTEFKFYWVNKSYYRMGISVYLGYAIARGKEVASVAMQDGMYIQRYEYNATMHSVDADVTIIPFHFRIKHTPITLESQVSLLGLSFVQFNPDKTDVPEEAYEQLKRSDRYPYIPKFGIKIGFVIE